MKIIFFMLTLFFHLIYMQPVHPRILQLLE